MITPAHYVLGQHFMRPAVSTPPAPTGIVASTNELADDHEGVFASLFAVGGVAPFTFTIEDGPAWASIEGNQLSADGTQTAGETTVPLKVVDALDREFEVEVPFTVLEGEVETPVDPPEGDIEIPDEDDPEFDGGGFEQPPVEQSTTDGLKITGRNGGAAHFLRDWGAPVAGGIYTMRYVADYSGLNRQGREAAIGFGFKDGNDFHLVGLRGNGHPNTQMLKSKIHGDFRKANQFTITDDGMAESGTKEGPNWLQIEIGEDGDTYTLRTSADGSETPFDELTWDDEYTDALPVPLAEATDALQFGPGAYFTNQDRGVFSITISRFEAAGIGLSYELTDTLTSASTDPSWNDVDIGEAAADRWVLLSVAITHTSSGFSIPVPTGIAINGIMSIYLGGGTRVNLGVIQQRIAYFAARIPAGATASISYTSGADRHSITVYRIVGDLDLVLSASSALSGSGGGLQTLSVDTADRGAAFGIAMRRNTNNRTIAGTMTEDADLTAGTNHRASHRSSETDGTVETVTFDEGLSLGWNMAAISIGPSDAEGIPFPSGPALNVALVTADTSNAAATNTRDAMQACGHTVTMYADSTLGSFDPDGYDVVVAVRTTNGDTVAGQLRPLIDAGVPMVIGITDQGISTNTSAVSVNASRMDLIGTCRIDAISHTSIEITDNSEPITDGFALGSTAIFSANNVGSWVEDSQPVVGTVLATQPSQSGRPTLIMIPQGTNDLESEELNANVVVGTLPYAGQSGHTFAGTRLLNRMLLWAAGEI